MRSPHPLPSRRVYLPHDFLTELPVLAFRPPGCSHSGCSALEGILAVNFPLCAADGFACGVVLDVVPVACWGAGVVVPETGLRFGEGGVVGCLGEAEDGEEELGEGLVGVVVCGPDDGHYGVEFGFGVDFFDGVARCGGLLLHDSLYSFRSGLWCFGSLILPCDVLLYKKLAPIQALTPSRYTTLPVPEQQFTIYLLYQNPLKR